MSNEKTELPDSGGSVGERFQFPRQAGGKGGWTIDLDYIMAICRQNRIGEGRSPTADVVEQVLISVENMPPPCWAAKQQSERDCSPRVIPEGATIDPNNVTDKDCADLAVCVEREHIKRTIAGVYATIESSRFSEPFKNGLILGVEELEFRLLESWGEDPMKAGPFSAANESAPHPEAACEECGRPNVTWFAPNPIWNAVGAPGFVCPVCFIKRAEAAGFNKDAWRIQPEFYAESTRGFSEPKGTDSMPQQGPSETP